MTNPNASIASQELDPQTVIAEAGTLVGLLDRAAADAPDRVYAVEWTGTQTTRRELLDLAHKLADALKSAGVGPGSRVAVALPNSLTHIAIVFATLRAGALWVPLNTKLRGESLHHQLRDSGATHLVADPAGDVINELVPVDNRQPLATAVAELARAQDIARATLWALTSVTKNQQSSPELPDSVVSIMYTSGTTGPAKGVQVTDSMLIAAAVGVVAAAEPRQDDTFYVWEPLFHIGGAQLLFLPLVAPVRLALSAHLSVSRFWDEAAALGATHIHHLGGILQMLLNRPATPSERAHKVRISWGAGATPESWEAVHDRFGIAVHECYGLTEASSIVTVNKGGAAEGIGQPLPWFEIGLAPKGAGGTSELLVRSTVPGLITPGYLNLPNVTELAWADDWWRTGDLVSLSENGNLHFLGRANDSVRVRGENVSAWQVESVFNTHPLIDACAAIGVQAAVGEQEIMLFVVPAAGADIDPAELHKWATQRMPEFHVPRYLRLVEELPMTPSRRVAKKKLTTELDGAFDLRRQV